MWSCAFSDCQCLSCRRLSGDDRNLGHRRIRCRIRRSRRRSLECCHRTRFHICQYIHSNGNETDSISRSLTLDFRRRHAIHAVLTHLLLLAADASLSFLRDLDLFGLESEPAGLTTLLSVLSSWMLGLERGKSSGGASCGWSSAMESDGREWRQQLGEAPRRSWERTERPCACART